MIEREQTRLARALDGTGEIDETTAPLLGVAARLRTSAGNVPPATNIAEARSKMLDAVRETRRGASGFGHARKVRGATLGAAALAGAGLLVASAATGKNPVDLASTAAAGFHGTISDRHSSTEAGGQVSLRGEVVAMRPDGLGMEIETEGTRVSVDLAGAMQATVNGDAGATVEPDGPDTAATLSLGANVAVEGSIREDTGEVVARTVTVEGPVEVTVSTGANGNATATVSTDTGPSTANVAVDVDATSNATGSLETANGTSADAGADVSVGVDVSADLNSSETPTPATTATAPPDANASYQGPSALIEVSGDGGLDVGIGGDNGGGD